MRSADRLVIEHPRPNFIHFWNRYRKRVMCGTLLLCPRLPQAPGVRWRRCFVPVVKHVLPARHRLYLLPSMSLRAARCVRILEQGKCSPTDAVGRHGVICQRAMVRNSRSESCCGPPTMRRQISSSSVQGVSLIYVCTP